MSPHRIGCCFAHPTYFASAIILIAFSNLPPISCVIVGLANGVVVYVTVEEFFYRRKKKTGD
jgi:hypothetical protein